MKASRDLKGQFKVCPDTPWARERFFGWGAKFASFPSPGAGPKDPFFLCPDGRVSESEGRLAQ